MNKQAFINLIKSPEAISEKDLEALEELTGSFPFCQIAHTLIAKAHYDKSSMLVHQKIKKASAYSLNRALLKKAIVGSTAIDSSFDNGAAVNSKAESSPSNTVERTIQPTEPQSTPADANAHNEEKPAHSVADDVVASIALLKATKKEQDSNLISSPSSIVDNKNINSVYTVTVQDNGTNLNENIVRRVPETNNSSLSNTKDKQFQSELIDRFISSNPRLTPGVIEDKPISNDDLASESSKLNETIVSENLAIIFTKQGKINKAKEIYKKLSLKYPEKSAYFAGKIDNLENK